MRKTSGALPPARSVCSLGQYESQSATVTFTVMFGLRALKASTIFCWLASSVVSPHIA